MQQKGEHYKVTSQKLLLLNHDAKSGSITENTSSKMNFTVTDFHLRSSWVRIKVSSKVMLGFEIKVDLCLWFLFYMLVYVQRVKTSKRFGN